MKVARNLEKGNIIADCGVRLGTCEVTRRGMRESEMEKIAEFIKRQLIDKDKGEKIKKEVIKFVRAFQRVEYCFRIS
jgi:glycine hydroxymethyltransferase